MAKLAIIWALIYASELFASHIPYSLHEEQARLASSQSAICNKK